MWPPLVFIGTQNCTLSCSVCVFAVWRACKAPLLCSVVPQNCTLSCSVCVCVCFLLPAAYTTSSKRETKKSLPLYEILIGVEMLHSVGVFAQITWTYHRSSKYGTRSTWYWHLRVRTGGSRIRTAIQCWYSFPRILNFGIRGSFERTASKIRILFMFVRTNIRIRVLE